MIIEFCFWIKVENPLIKFISSLGNFTVYIDIVYLVNYDSYCKLSSIPLKLWISDKDIIRF